MRTAILLAAGDYVAARATLEDAVDFCAQTGEAEMRRFCTSCLSYVLWRTGDWDRAVELAQVVRAEEADDLSPRRTPRSPGGRWRWRAGTRAARGHCWQPPAHIRRASAAFHRDSARRTSSRRLGAQPLAAEPARALEALGERIDARLGRLAAAHVRGGGLTRRELGVVRHVAVGRTNREIAEALHLSPRTVEMHVRNALSKLECRTRTEASSRAIALGLIDPISPVGV